jgi:hypothetical protein
MSRTNKVQSPHRGIRATLGFALAAVSLVGSSWGPQPVAARPNVGHGSVVPARPRADVVRILDGSVLDSEVIGDRIIVAGSFTQVRDTNGVTVGRPYLLAYDKNTGALDNGFDPVLCRWRVRHD